MNNANYKQKQLNIITNLILDRRIKNEVKMKMVFNNCAQVTIDRK